MLYSLCTCCFKWHEDYENCVHATSYGLNMTENSIGPELAMAQTKLDWSYLFNGKNKLEKGENNKKSNIKRPWPRI